MVGISWLPSIRFNFTKRLNIELIIPSVGKSIFSTTVVLSTTDKPLLETYVNYCLFRPTFVFERKLSSTIGVGWERRFDPILYQK